MKAILFSLSCLIVISATGQKYYPGGLGNSSLILWMDANKSSSITQNGSAQVSQWSSIGGTTYNFTQATTANKPVYSATGGPNSRPALTFDGTSSQYLSNASIPSTISWTSGVTTMAVASYTQNSSGTGWERIFDLGQNGSQDDNIWFGKYSTTTNIAYESWNGGNGNQTYTTSNPVVYGTNKIYEVQHKGGTVGNGTAVAFATSGTSQTGTGQAGSAITYVPTAVTRTKNYIARSNWSTDNYFSGTMSEILLYNTMVNTTQRIILENYLAARWGLTVAVSKYTTPTSTTYGTNLVGVGMQSSTDYFVADIAGSTDGFGFSTTYVSTSFLYTSGYLMAAHNGQANTIISPATVPGITANSGTIQRWNRSWYLQKNGGNASGTVSVVFNFDDYSGSTPNSTYGYGLLYNATDGSFATGTNKLIYVTSTSVSGNTVTFGATGSLLSNGYYTLIWTTNGTLPVQLDNWSVQRQNTTSLLTWNCAQGCSYTRFGIQRSSDGANWTRLATVAASSMTLTSGDSYTYTDENPITGLNYYRLQLIDADGNITYSPVKVIQFSSSSTPGLSVYPNPVDNVLHADLSELTGEARVVLYNAAGQRVYQSQVTAPSLAEIPMSGLPRGIYTVVVYAGQGRYTAKTFKN